MVLEVDSEILEIYPIMGSIGSKMDKLGKVYVFEDFEISLVVVYYSLSGQSSNEETKKIFNGL